MWIFSKISGSSGFRPFTIAQGRGFTLVELLVASGIILIITSVLLFRHERFNSSTLLRSLSYSIALSVRQAQLYGTSVRETAAGSAVFPSYGVYFKSGSGNDKQYFLGADTNGDSSIATDGSEDVSPPSPYTLNGNYEISAFCAYTDSGASHCYTFDGVANDIIDALTIRFERPNPDALFSTSQSGYSYIEACVEVESPGEDTRAITVTNTGQISVSESAGVCDTS